jgi:hypothetical protein
MQILKEQERNVIETGTANDIGDLNLAYLLLIELGARLQFIEAEVASAATGCCACTRKSRAPRRPRACCPFPWTGT